MANKGNTTLNNTTVSFNHSYGSGAGIYNYRSDRQNSFVTLNVKDSLITANQSETTGTDSGGGGIYNYRAEVTLNNTKVTNNYSQKAGGGIFSNGNKDKPGKLVITNQSEISNNTAISGGFWSDWGGGGVLNGQNGIMEISDSLLNGNQINGSKSRGGAICNIGLATLSRLTIANNDGHHGGGIAQDGTGELSLTDSVVEENTAVSKGGGLFLGGEAIIENSFIRNNQTTDSSGDGGGIHVDHLEGGDATITNTIIADNQAADHGGGINNERDLTLINSQIINNQAQDGGGVYHDRSSLLLIDSNIDNNQAINGDGGGLYNNGTILDVVNSSITNNTATNGSGGGIYHTKGTLSRDPLLNLIGSTVAGNKSDGDGAGIFFPVTNSVHNIINSTIINNIADADADGIGLGGGILAHKPTLTDWADVSLKNTVIAYNKTGLGIDSDVYGGVINYYNFESNNNNLIGNTNGVVGYLGRDAFGENDLLDIDPLLGPLQDNGNGRLTSAPLAGSPLIDAGFNDNLPADTYDVDKDGDTDELLPLDGRGDDRIKAGTVDIGAVEGTGNDNPTLCSLDIDGDGQYSAAVDGLLYYGYLNIRNLPDPLPSQLTQQLADNLINPNGNATRTEGTEIADYLESCQEMMDVDGDGTISAAIDGLLTYGYLNIRGIGVPDLITNLMNQLADNLIPEGSNATRNTGAQLAEFLGSYII